MARWAAEEAVRPAMAGGACPAEVVQEWAPAAEVLVREGAGGCPRRPC